MKKYLLFIIPFCIANPLLAQYVYTINADSVKITNHCDTAELIIENHTQNVPGFLFNKGRGRTEFRRGFVSIDDSTYIIGADTLNLSKGLNALTANNGLLRTGNTFQFGNDDSDPLYGPAYQFRPTYYNQNSNIFNWIAGVGGIFNVSKNTYSTTETNVLSPYHIARFTGITLNAAGDAQGGILLENSLNAYFSAPLTWLSFKNNRPDAAKFSFFGDSVAAQFATGVRRGVDGKAYTEFHFTVADDTAYSTTGYDNAALKLYPSYTAASGGPLKIPTAVVKRLDITDGVKGAFDNFQSFSYNNPYSRLVVDAKNYPLAINNLPSGAGRPLVVDNNGQVWKGDSIGTSQPTNWALTGNTGTDPSVNFIGTADYQPLTLSTNSSPAMTIQADGKVGIGTTTPLTKVQIYKAGEDGQFAVTGDAPSMRLWGPTADLTAGWTYGAVMGLGTTVANYTADAVAGDLVISDFTHNSIIFSTNYLATYLDHTDEKMRINGDGHVGINTHNPTAKLHVVDSVRFENLPPGTGSNLLIDADGYLHVQAANAATPGTINSSLAVNGDITAHKMTLTQAGWPDYVFDSAYHRLSLTELAQYIKNNSHLPEIPAAAEVAKKGIDVGNNQAALLKKIEELTLYLIEHEQKWEAQDKELKQQNQQLQALKQEMEEMKKLITKQP